MEISWQHLFARRTQRMKSSAIRELLKLTEQPDVISFGGGLPAPDVFPIPEVKKACEYILLTQGARALQYSTTEGYIPLREMIADRLAQDGIKVTIDNILITAGSQQALDLIGKVFINRKDHVVVETPTYLGALQAWNAYEAEYTGVLFDNDGMRVDSLESILSSMTMPARSFRNRPKFIYVLPNFQNPTGVTLSLERRRKLVELADCFGILIVEDDPYGKLRFEGEPLPPVVVLDGQMRDCQGCYSGNVIYVGTFSKILAPGLRLAWVIAPVEVIHKLVQAKQGSDLHTATFNQMIAYEVSRNGFLDQHILTIQKVYRERRDVMLEALEEHMPAGVHWTHPQGGLFLWVTLPKGINAAFLLAEAVKEKVAFVPGSSFYPNGGGENTMRLNFSNATPERIREGITRLGRVTQRFLRMEVKT